MCGLKFINARLGMKQLVWAGNIAESGLGLSDDEIDYLLANDIKRVREELTDCYFWFPAMNEARQDALVDISFNLGTNTFAWLC